jgi:Bacterial Ig-like domain
VGSWKASHGGTRYTFKPEKALNKNGQYSIIVTTKVKDKAGTPLDRKKIVQFRVAAES